MDHLQAENRLLSMKMKPLGISELSDMGLQMGKEKCYYQCFNGLGKPPAYPKKGQSAVFQLGRSVPQSHDRRGSRSVLAA